MLSLVNVDKRFPGVHALKRVSIDVMPGEVVGLIGENGAGKSTLMKILSGVYRHDAGEIRVAGRQTRFTDAADANSQGIGMVFQEQSLLTNLSVGENVYLGNERQFARFGIVDWRSLYNAAARQLAKVKVDVDPRTRTEDLGFAARQMVELAKALTLEDKAQGHLIILLDEPTSVLERAEIEILFARVRALKSRASFIFVSHRLDEVLELADRIYVMKDGAVVAERHARDADISELHQLMVGRSLKAEYYREPSQKPYLEEIALAVDGLSLAGAYRNVSFQLHRGEDSGHRRSDRVGARGADADLRRLRASRRRPAGDPRARGRTSHAGRSGGQRHWLYSARTARRRPGAVPASRSQHYPGGSRQPEQLRTDRRP